MTTVCLTGSI